MKFTIAALLSTAALAAAVPTGDKKYGATAGKFHVYPSCSCLHTVAYTKSGGLDTVDWTKIDYPKGTGADAVPKGGWENVKYPPGTGANPAACPPALFKFTSTYHIKATPDQVVNGTMPTGGLAGCSGTYDIGLDSVSNTVCYNITLYGFSGDYSSPAKTATHLHEAAKGKSGSPRIAFPNPVGSGRVRSSIGCITGPFTTGVMANGADTGAAFHVSQIEKNPAGFFVDVHSSLAVPGAVRGQVA